MSGRLAPFPRFTGAEPCQAPDTDPNWWTSDNSNDRAAAQLACRRCPLAMREACLAWALDHPTDAGDAIWAGTTRTRRSQLRREFTTTAPKEPK
ncbi:WhiB family transcriptional regulator [Streptomyces sp. HNM0663]|uniref:WhiB family transcriptional regulator n=1 Tax=Streptomyces chengmaiensis TaxID=3040919 RepID=A0ABT6HZY1_9ACTN|nr:WhiB family transcriptional regulator [Streptomyces chengmaiensis]MDH2393409.1 WhiB family transcriptional regulator [Streptomyces chengmaiensis]